MSSVGPRWSEFAKLMAHHVFSHEDRNVLSAVVHGKRMPDHVGNDRRAARPGFYKPFLAGAVHRLDLLHQMVVDEISFLNASCHGSI